MMDTDIAIGTQKVSLTTEMRGAITSKTAAAVAGVVNRTLMMASCLIYSPQPNHKLKNQIYIGSTPKAVATQK